MNGSGIGGDIGLVYEWRPRETNRVGVRNSSRAVNIYKLKISAAVLDIGSVNYKGENDDILLRNFVPNTTIATPTSVQELFTSLITNNGAQNPQERGNVTFALPRSLNIGLDYIIFNDKNYYLNLNYIKGLNSTEDEYANTRLDLITLTPRFETRDFSAYLPISYEATTGIYAGLGIRYKYVTVGCAALNTFVSNKPLNHIYFGINLPILEEVFR